MIKLILEDKSITELHTAHDLYLQYNDWVSINDATPDEYLTETLETIRDNYSDIWDNFSGTYRVDDFEHEAMQFLRAKYII